MYKLQDIILGTLDKLSKLFNRSGQALLVWAAMFSVMETCPEQGYLTLPSQQFVLKRKEERKLGHKIFLPHSQPIGAKREMVQQRPGTHLREFCPYKNQW